MGVSAPLEIGTDQDRPRGGDSFRDMLEWWRMRGKKCHSTLFANKSDASRTARRWWRQSQWTVLIKKINRVFINIPANPRFWPPPATIYIYICKRPRNKMSLGKWKTKLQIARLISPFLYCRRFDHVTIDEFVANPSLRWGFLKIDILSSYWLVSWGRSKRVDGSGSILINPPLLIFVINQSILITPSAE